MQLTNNCWRSLRSLGHKHMVSLASLVILAHVFVPQSWGVIHIGVILKEFLKTHFEYIDPSPFFIWGLLAFIAHLSPIPTDYVQGNATVINLAIGAVIVSVCLSILIFTLVFFTPKKGNKFFEYTHWFAKLFSDAALGSTGFIVVLEALVNENITLAFGICSLALLYIVVFNHVFLTVFNKDVGTRALVKNADIDNGTDINLNSGDGYRKVEVYLMAGVLLVIIIVVLGIWSGLKSV